MIKYFGEYEDLHINCNAGSFSIRIIKKTDTFWQAHALIESDWFRCEIDFECSIDRAIEFNNSLRELIQNGEGEVNFINEDGNIDLNINLNTKGQVKIDGCACKNMLDKSLVKFDLESERNELEKFFKNFEAHF